MSRPLPALTLAASLAVTPRVALACGACRGAGGAGGAVTATDENVGVQLSLLGRREIGTWDARGRAHAEPDGVSAHDLTAQVALAYRPIRTLELALFGGGGMAWLRAPGLAQDGGGASDLTARVRFDWLAEDRAHPDRVGSAAWFAVRAPTGSTPAVTEGSSAGIVGAFGLGAWELALGADVRRTFADHWQPFGALEFAWRASDASAGFARTLGPRGTARTGLTYFAGEQWAFSALLEWTGETDVALRGQVVPDSWQQRTSIAVGASLHAENGLRAAVSLATDVPMDSLGRNAEATVRLGLSIGWSHVVPAWRVCPVPVVSGGGV